MILTWYTYFSWWIFIWFILFKLNLIKFSPYLIYLFTVVFIGLKFIRDIVYYLFYDEKKIKNYNLILIWVLLVITIDIIPFFYLQPTYNIESIIFTLLLLLLYCLCMEIWGINIINHYLLINYRDLSDNYTDANHFLKSVFNYNV